MWQPEAEHVSPLGPENADADHSCERPLDVPARGRDDVVARAAHRRAVVLLRRRGGRVGRRVRAVRRRGFWMLAAHHEVAREVDGGVVVAPSDRVDRVAEKAGHALVAGGQRGEVQAVRGQAVADGHGAWHLHAERPERALGLALPARVHRDEDRVVGRLRVHALGQSSKWPGGRRALVGSRASPRATGTSSSAGGRCCCCCSRPARPPRPRRPARRGRPTCSSSSLSPAPCGDPEQADGAREERSAPAADERDVAARARRRRRGSAVRRRRCRPRGLRTAHRTSRRSRTAPRTGKRSASCRTRPLLRPRRRCTRWAPSAPG